MDVTELSCTGTDSRDGTSFTFNPFATPPDLLWGQHVGEDGNGEDLEHRAAQSTQQHSNQHHIEVLGKSLHSNIVFILKALTQHCTVFMC